MAELKSTTISGPLAGTSATFSGNISLGSTLVSNGTATILSTDATETRITLGSASNASYAQIVGIYNGGTPVIPVRILGSQVARFSTASFDVTGAATFSSSIAVLSTGISVTIDDGGKQGYTITNSAAVRTYKIIAGIDGTSNTGFSIRNVTAGRNELLFTDAGAATFSSGISVGGATATTGGIQFPATAVAIASANNLDDYEEGTWTIGLTFGGNSVGLTFASNTGTYTKVGRQVTVNGIAALSNKGSSTGVAKITGLPFTIPNSDSNYSALSLRFDGITYTGQFQGYGVINTTTLNLEEITEAGSRTGIADTDFTNSSAVLLTFTYFV